MQKNHQVQNANPTINIEASRKEVEPLIVGNANTIIRFLSGIFILMTILLSCLIGSLFYKAGQYEHRLRLLEDILINQYYVVEVPDAGR